ncbi:hypothetical protein ACNIWB_26290, partial [Escherichia coli]
LMMSLWDALRMNMMISYQELVRTFLSTRGGMVEFVKNNHTGFHINEPMLPESLASDIYETLHSEKLEQIANNGKKYVLENYLWWQVTHKFENVLENWFR